MAQYTQQDFINAYNAGGWNNSNFSQQDYELGMKDPDAGMAIIYAKSDYARASTPEARALANQNAEAIRASAGYSGGTTGMNNNDITSSTPSSVPTTSVEPEKYNGTIQITGLGRNPFNNEQYNKKNSDSTSTEKSEKDNQSIWEKIAEYIGLKNPYKSNTTSPESSGGANDAVVSSNNSSESAGSNSSTTGSTNSLWDYYKTQYNREGSRAAEDTMGIAAAMTGGIPSSYAVSAAQQQQNYYNQQLMDKYPELYLNGYTNNSNTSADSESGTSDTTKSTGTSSLNGTDLLSLYASAAANNPQLYNTNDTKAEETEVQSENTSYIDFLNAYAKANKENGITFTAEDFELAKVDPAAALAILQAKIGWVNAKNSSERAYWNQIAESYRNQYGYTGGADGKTPSVLPTATASQSAASALPAPTASNLPYSSDQGNGFATLPESTDKAEVTDLSYTQNPNIQYNANASVRQLDQETIAATNDPVIQQYLRNGGNITPEQLAELRKKYSLNALLMAGLTLVV